MPSRGPPPQGEFSMEDLVRLDQNMVGVSAASVAMTAACIYALFTDGLFMAQAIEGGEATAVRIGASSVAFSDESHASRFCEARAGFLWVTPPRHKCTLEQLCATRKSSTDRGSYTDTIGGVPLYTSWRSLADAASVEWKVLFATTLLCGLTAVSAGMYGAQSIPWVANLFDKIEDLGFTDDMQKMILAVMVVAETLGMLWAIFPPILMAPSSLGWGPLQLGAGYGAIMLGVPVAGAAVASSCS